MKPQLIPLQKNSTKISQEEKNFFFSFYHLVNIVFFFITGTRKMKNFKQAWRNLKKSVSTIDCL